jgi:hypothetical protein
MWIGPSPPEVGVVPVDMDGAFSTNHGHMSASDRIDTPSSSGQGFAHGMGADQLMNLNLSVANLLPVYESDWPLDYESSHLQQQNQQNVPGGGFIRVPDAHIYNSFVPEIEKPVEDERPLSLASAGNYDDGSDSPTTTVQAQDGRRNSASDASGGNTSAKDAESSLRIAVAMAEDVFKRLDAQIAGLKL